MQLQRNEHLPHYAIFKKHGLKIGEIARAIGRSYGYTANTLVGNMPVGKETMKRLDELVKYLEREGA